MPLIKTKPTPQPRIIKEVMALARQKRGLSQEDVMRIICLQKHHIAQLEDLDTRDAFYTAAIKVRAARKTGSHLSLSESQHLEN